MSRIALTPADKMALRKEPMKGYLSHTSECSGWDLDTILQGTVFQKGASTSRFPKNEQNVKMLDWDFRRAKKIGKKELLQEQLEIIQSFDIELVFGPDCFIDSDVTFITSSADLLSDYCERVVIPVHGFYPELKNYELALPTAGGFNPVPKNYWLYHVREFITHILGGSPHTQLELLAHLPNVTSVDGNQMFWCAVNFGKYWEGGRWVTPEPRLTNKECFKKSIQNYNIELTNGRG